jgi:hypothetical protein
MPILPFIRQARSNAMKIIPSVLVILSGFVATEASAQGVNLSGRYVCVQACRTGVTGLPAFVTQNGWNMNLLNEAGVPSRAWIDWQGHIWAENYQEGAVYSPDGMVIQFDRGTVWQRDLALPPPLLAPPHYRR